MRIHLDKDPFAHTTQDLPWQESSLWPASWVSFEGAQAPFVAAFRLVFELEETAAESVRVHVSADERYELFLDGKLLGRGPERGAPDLWFFDSYSLTLSAGSHVLVARVWALGDIGMEAQMTVAPGFLLAGEREWSERLSTGLADWEVLPLKGYSFHPTGTQRGCRFTVDARKVTPNHESGGGRGWKPVKPLQRAMGRWTSWDFFHKHRLVPAGLPEMQETWVDPALVRHIDEAGGTHMQRAGQVVLVQASKQDEVGAWQALLSKKQPLTIPAHTTRRVIMELPDYTTAYPLVEVSGGRDAQLEVYWAEALHTTPNFFSRDKGQRDEIEGKFFTGIGDRWVLDGRLREHTPLYWIAGRFVEIAIQTQAQALTVHRLDFLERRYPLERISRFSCSDERLNEIQSILLRGMQMCSNETFMDCPYYEEMMYVGDTRLEMLTTYVLNRDTRLPLKALRLFDASRMASAMIQSRYPSKSTQVISTFSLWWVGMVHDFLYWQPDTGVVRELLPGVRATIQGFERLVGEDGLLYGAEGWNTIDWVPAWEADAGTPPDGHWGASGVLNWQYVYALSLYADLERRIGDSEMADWALRRVAEQAVAAENAFWNEERGLFSDTLDHTRYSEHSQILALLSGFVDPQRVGRVVEALFSAEDLDRATIYFSFYYFEVCRKFNRMDRWLDRMGLWFDLKSLGFKTPMEMPEPSRSDCHAWSSHPLFHLYATILGIRPAEPGFRSVVIEPRLGALTWAEGEFPHPSGGWIRVRAERNADGTQMRVQLPEGLGGVLVLEGASHPLGVMGDALIFNHP